jgi:hypothetical protein
LNAQDHREGLRALPLNPMECGLFLNPHIPLSCLL